MFLYGNTCGKIIKTNKFVSKVMEFTWNRMMLMTPTDFFSRRFL